MDSTPLSANGTAELELTQSQRGRDANAGSGVVDVPARPARVRRWKVRSYLALTKPRIIELLLVTTVPTMILAAQGWPGTSLVLVTLMGVAAAAGSANAFNCYVDRDIDKIMRRTANRPLATGAVSPRGALIFATVLALVSLVVLGVWANLLAAGLALAANVMYVVGYTMVLKRRTPQNIVWGGAAGCMPVLIGWAAVQNGLSWQPLVLFGIVFWWTPPHYWPLSLRFRDDYAAAQVPMLPVVASPVHVAQQVVSYTWVLVLWSYLLVPAMGLVYLVGVTVAGAMFLRQAYGLLRRAKHGSELHAMRVFHQSITYLSVVFMVVAIDPFVTSARFWG